MLSPELELNVWRTECEGLAFKIYRFLEVYSENCSLHRRLWRHGGRTNSLRARSAARRVALSPRGAPLFAAFLRRRLGLFSRLGLRTAAPSLGGVSGGGPWLIVARGGSCLRSTGARSQESRGSFSLSAFQEWLQGLTPPRRAALTKPSFWEFTASTLKIIGMHTGYFQ